MCEILVTLWFCRVWACWVCQDVLSLWHHLSLPPLQTHHHLPWQVSNYTSLIYLSLNQPKHPCSVACWDLEHSAPFWHCTCSVFCWLCRISTPMYVCSSAYRVIHDSENRTAVHYDIAKLACLAGATYLLTLVACCLSSLCYYSLYHISKMKYLFYASSISCSYSAVLGFSYVARLFFSGFERGGALPFLLLMESHCALPLFLTKYIICS